MNKYEQLIEHIINDDEAKARALFHSIVVERSREIYESLMDTEEGLSQDAVGGLVDEIQTDETGMHEADEEMPGDDMSGDPAGMDDMDNMDDMGGMDDMDSMDGAVGDSDAPATKGDIMDLESAIDELKAEFDRLMSDEGSDDMGGEDDFGSSDDEAGDEEGEEADDEEGEEDDAGKNPFAESNEEDEDSVAESRRAKSDAERIREYVDKVGVDWDKGAYKGPKGENVGTGDKSERQGEKNTKSPLAGKNDMGGTTKNIVQGGSEADPSGQRPNGKAGGFLKSPQEIDVAKRNVNKPGGNKGAQNYYDTKASAKSGEQSVNSNSPLNGAPGRAK